MVALGQGKKRPSVCIQRGLRGVSERLDRFDGEKIHRRRRKCGDRHLSIHLELHRHGSSSSGSASACSPPTGLKLCGNLARVGGTCSKTAF